MIHDSQLNSRVVELRAKATDLRRLMSVKTRMPGHFIFETSVLAGRLERFFDEAEQHTSHLIALRVP